MVKLDDVVGAVPAHLVAGVWGTLAVCITAGGDFGVQLIGVLAIGAFVFAVSLALWFLLQRTVGVRVSETVEEIGQDSAELGHRGLSGVRGHARCGRRGGVEAVLNEDRREPVRCN